MRDFLKRKKEKLALLLVLTLLIGLVAFPINIKAADGEARFTLYVFDNNGGQLYQNTYYYNVDESARTVSPQDGTSDVLLLENALGNFNMYLSSQSPDKIVGWYQDTSQATFLLYDYTSGSAASYWKTDSATGQMYIDASAGNNIPMPQLTLDDFWGANNSYYQTVELYPIMASRASLTVYFGRDEDSELIYSDSDFDNIYTREDCDPILIPQGKVFVGWTLYDQNEIDIMNQSGYYVTYGDDSEIIGNIITGNAIKVHVPNTEPSSPLTTLHLRAETADPSKGIAYQFADTASQSSEDVSSLRIVSEQEYQGYKYSITVPEYTGSDPNFIGWSVPSELLSLMLYSEYNGQEITSETAITSNTTMTFVLPFVFSGPEFFYFNVKSGNTGVPSGSNAVMIRDGNPTMIESGRQYGLSAGTWSMGDGFEYVVGGGNTGVMTFYLAPGHQTAEYTFTRH